VTDATGLKTAREVQLPDRKRVTLAPVALVCEDLSSYGVVLIPPDSRQYFDLLADIERRLQNRPQGSPPLPPNVLSRISEHDTSGSAILVNRARVAIATQRPGRCRRPRRDRRLAGHARPRASPALKIGSNLFPTFAAPASASSLIICDLGSNLTWREELATLLRACF
jgi:hypothetical protein